MDNWLVSLEEEFRKAANPVDVAPMEKYMRHLFPFLGLKKPLRTAILKPYLKAIRSAEEALVVAEILWEKEEREFQYAALDVLQLKVKKVDDQQLFRLKELVVSKSWWDTVDRLAASIIGTAVKKHEAQRKEVHAWRNEGHLWLDRTALLFQLKYKEDTQREMLAQTIQQFAASKEFFHQKAIGWALRTYKRTDPEWVAELLHRLPLSALSVREARK